VHIVVGVALGLDSGHIAVADGGGGDHHFVDLVGKGHGRDTRRHLHGESQCQFLQLVSSHICSPDKWLGKIGGLGESVSSPGASIRRQYVRSVKVPWNGG